MSTEQRDLLQSQTNAEEALKENSSEILTKKDVPDTPFCIMGGENIYFMVMGNYKITPNFKTEESLWNWYTSHQWEISITIMGIVYESLKTKNQ